MTRAPAAAFASAVGALLFPVPAAVASSEPRWQIPDSNIATPTALVVAFSGGCDSTVLLRLAWAYAKTHDLPLRAIHINHQLQAAASEFVRHCEQACRELHVPLQVLTVEVLRTDKGLEADARQARYNAFATSLQANELLLLGQHADDQIETLVLQLLRGAGPLGLAGMPASAACGVGRLCRPLLSVRRDDIRFLAEQQGWGWIDDPSNDDHALARNRLRAELMPVLLTQRAGAADVLLRAMQWQAEAATLLADLAQLDLAAVQYPNGLLARSRLLALTPARQANVLRSWLQQQQQQLPAPNADQLQSFLAQLPADSDRLCLQWGGYQLRVAADQIVLLPALPNSPLATVPWHEPSALTLPAGLGTLAWAAPSERAAGESGLPMRPPQADETVSIRWQVPGLRVALAKRTGRRELKDIFQEYQVPAWLRPCWPKLFYNDTLIALPGLLVTAAGQPTGAFRCLNANGPLFTLAARLRTPDAERW